MADIPALTEQKRQLNRLSKHDEFQRHVAEVLTTMVKLKRVMLARGLRRAKTKCPRCGCVGALQGGLVGQRNHMRMWCETPSCSMEAME